MNKFLTKHTNIRSSHRGLKTTDVAILFKLGKLGFRLKSYHSGAIYWFFGKKIIDKLIELKKLNPNVANKYIGTTLIVDLNEETIITVIKEKKGPNQIRKNLKGKRKRNNYLKGGNL